MACRWPPPARPLRQKALRRFADLYAVESAIRGQIAAERQGMRQSQSLQLVAGMHQFRQIAPRGGLADAIRYALTRWSSTPIPWSALSVRTTLCRIRWGAERWAIVCSLVATAKLNDVEPFAYLKDILQRTSAGHPTS